MHTIFRWSLSAILFSLANFAFADDCALDPKKCTPKKLCDLSTESKDASKKWSPSSLYLEHVTLAKKLGIEL